jgi:hypothetical protein
MHRPPFAASGASVFSYLVLSGFRTPPAETLGLGAVGGAAEALAREDRRRRLTGHEVRTSSAASLGP